MIVAITLGLGLWPLTFQFNFHIEHTSMWAKILCFFLPSARRQIQGAVRESERAAAAEAAKAAAEEKKKATKVRLRLWRKLIVRLLEVRRDKRLKNLANKVWKAYRTHLRIEAAKAADEEERQSLEHQAKLEKLRQENDLREAEARKKLLDEAAAAKEKAKLAEEAKKAAWLKGPFFLDKKRARRFAAPSNSLLDCLLPIMDGIALVSDKNFKNNNDFFFSKGCWHITNGCFERNPNPKPRPFGPIPPVLWTCTDIRKGDVVVGGKLLKYKGEGTIEPGIYHIVILNGEIQLSPFTGTFEGWPLLSTKKIARFASKLRPPVNHPKPAISGVGMSFADFCVKCENYPCCCDIVALSAALAGVRPTAPAFVPQLPFALQPPLELD